MDILSYMIIEKHCMNYICNCRSGYIIPGHRVKDFISHKYSDNLLKIGNDGS